MDHRPDPHCKHYIRHLTMPFRLRQFLHTRKKRAPVVHISVGNRLPQEASHLCLYQYGLHESRIVILAVKPHQTGADLPFRMLLIKFRNPEFNRQILGAIFQYNSSHFSSFPVKNKKRLHNTTASLIIFYEWYGKASSMPLGIGINPFPFGIMIPGSFAFGAIPWDWFCV